MRCLLALALGRGTSERVSSRLHDGICYFSLCMEAEGWEVFCIAMAHGWISADGLHSDRIRQSSFLCTLTD